MGKSYRSGRLSGEIQKIVSSMLLHGLKDPRLSSGLISVSAVEVTTDGSYATVYITMLAIGNKTEEEKREEMSDVLDAFESAKGLIRREISRKVKLRHVPELIFKEDTSFEYGRHIDEVIDSLGIENYSSDENPEE